VSSITSKALKLKQLAACLSGGHGQNASSPPFATEGPVSVMILTKGAFSSFTVCL